MATAKIETVKKTVEKEIQERVYTLTLSAEEAKTLAALVGGVIGNNRVSYAAHTSEIYKALCRAGHPAAYFSSHFVSGPNGVTAKPLPYNLLPSF